MRKSRKMIELEQKYNMEYCDILKKLYIDEKKSFPQISKELGYDTSQLSRQCKKLGIPVRTRKESYENWWDNASDEDKKAFIENSKNIGNTILKKESSRDNLRKVMQTDEYKNKISIKNKGKNNGMYKSNLDKEHRVEKRALFGYKKWSKDVRERDNYTCCVCGLQTKEPAKLHAHHLESYHTHEHLRLDIDNGITVCNVCHVNFHNKHRFQKTTKKQFEEYLKENKKIIVPRGTIA